MNAEVEIQKEKERLLRSDIPQEAKQDILNFLNEMLIDGKSFSHQYYYGTRLRIIAGILQDKFTDPTKDDIKWLLNQLIERKAKTGRYIEKQRRQATIEDYKKTIKHYYKWKLGTGEGKARIEPDCTRWITRNRKLGSRVKPEELITKEEYEKILDSCMNARDRALISVLYDSGVRIGEALSLRIRDAQSDQYGYILAVTGKTGFMCSHLGHFVGSFSSSSSDLIWIPLALRMASSFRFERTGWMNPSVYSSTLQDLP